MVFKVYVDFKGINCSVFFEKGDNVLKLFYFVVIVFSDVSLNKVFLVSLELLKYDESI